MTQRKKMSIITDDRIEQYIDSLWRPQTPLLAGLRGEAEEAGIPVIRKETENLLITLLMMKRPQRILEIGTSVGYSALCMAEAAPGARIVTMELRQELRDKALGHFAAAGKQDQIWALLGDALVLLRQMAEEGGEGLFDFVFLDGAHGHYLDMWQAFFPLCKKGAVVVSDDVLFRGMTASDEFLDERRNRTIMVRMREYLNYLTELRGVRTSVLASGDGTAISVIE